MDKYRLNVGQQVFEMTSADVAAADLVYQKGAYHILDDNQSYQAKVLAIEGKTITLSVNNNIHKVTIADEVDQLVDQMGLNKVKDLIIKDIKAPMPGLILEIKVKAGQAVTAGDPLLILEAMKMENVIKAAAEGVVKEVLLAKGSTVDKNQVIIEME